MHHTFVQVTFMFALTSFGTVSMQKVKPYTLQILELLPKTGNPPRTGEDCQLASQVVVEHVNKRSDILPMYHLEIVSDDEGSNGVKSPTSLLNFSDKIEGDHVFVSPAIIAGYFSTGCKAIGSFLHQLGLTAFSISCTGVFLTDRSLYPNLYLTRAIATKLSQGQLQFIRNIGRWRRIAILSNFASANDFMAGEFLYRIAYQHNTSVVWYDGIMDLNSHAPIISLKKNDARIIVFWATQINLARQFLCLAHQYGMTGSKYIFIVPGTMLTDLSALREQILPGCTKKVLLEQYKYSFGTGQLQVPIVMDSASHLGYDANKFEEMFDRYTNKSRKVDYDYRYQCHDAVMSVILTLENAEKAMQESGLNITLRDFRNQPKLVGNFVNESAAKLDYEGLRVGRVKYSPTGELATDFSILTYWGKGYMELLGTVRQQDNQPGLSNDDYYIKVVRNVSWLTPGGEPPRDAARSVRVLRKAPVAVRAVVIALAAATAGAELLSAIFAKHAQISETLVKTTGLVGCVVLDVAAILFSLDVWQLHSELLWQCKVALVVIPLILIDSMAVGRLVTWLHLVANHKAPKLIGRLRTVATTVRHYQPSLASVESHRPSNSVSLRKLSLPEPSPKGCFIIEIAAMSFSIIGILAWFLSDRISCKVKTSKLYNPVEDAQISNLTMFCGSETAPFWLLAFLSFHVTWLLVGCVLSFKTMAKSRSFAIPEKRFMILSVVNLLGASLCGGFAIVIFESDPVTEGIIMSFLCIFLSASTAASLLIPRRKL